MMNLEGKIALVTGASVALVVRLLSFLLNTVPPLLVPQRLKAARLRSANT